MGGSGTGALLGAGAAAFATGGGSLLFNAAVLAGGAAVGSVVAPALKEMTEGPDVPKAPKPEAPVDAGDEGIRRGEMKRASRRRALGQIHLTRGQDRASDATLGARQQRLG